MAVQISTSRFLPSKQTFTKPIHATLSNSPLSNHHAEYLRIRPWCRLRYGERLRPWRKLVPLRRESTHQARRPRHCGLDPQSRGEGPGRAYNKPKPTARSVILALRQYPQGRATTRQHNQPNPLSLDGRGIKGEGDSKKTPTLCHSEQSEESKISAPHDPGPSLRT